MNKNLLKVILAAVIVGGCFFRILELDSRSLEYDEIWTMTHYFKCTFSEIFTKLETPNNHPLHTLIAQKMCSIFGETSWALRLCALLSGIMLLFAVLWAAMKSFRSKYAVFACAALTAFSPYLVHYSQTARGYSMQAFFVFVLMFLLLSYARRPSIIKAIGVFFTASAILFTVYSGLIFVCAAGGAYLCSFVKWRDWKKELKKNFLLFTAGAGFCIVAALWLGMNWNKITQAQQFGVKISSAGQFFQSVGHLIYSLGLLLPMIIIAAVFVLRPKDKILRFGLVFSILVFISVLVTKCGPERVYMPMIAVMLFCAARGIEVAGARFRKIKYIEAAMTATVCFPLVFILSDMERISPPDWRYFVTQIEKMIPEECYVVYSAGDTYPIYANYKECALHLAAKSENKLTIAGFISAEKQKISCMDKGSSAKTFSLGTALENYPLPNNYNISIYGIEPLTAANFRKGKSVLVFFVFMPKRQYYAVRKQLLLKDECYLLNAFFNRDYTSDYDREAVRAIPYLIPSVTQEYDFYAKLAEYSGSKLRFYVLNAEVQ